jgi:hypothetical protein
MTTDQVHRFGRIPSQTVDLVQGIVRAVGDQVLTALPASTSPEIRAYTMETVLGIVLRDWSENENTSGLLPEDIEDLRSFIALAASVAGNDVSGPRAPIYEATLAGLLEDWLANWNTEGDPGPPGPID